MSTAPLTLVSASHGCQGALREIKWISFVQVIGICRFSYLGFGGFQVKHPDLQARAAYLYDNARMEQRFAFFETICLPSVQAQTDPDFKFLVVTGEDMPAHQVDRLHGVLKDIPQAVIEALPPGPHRAVMHKAIETHTVSEDSAGLQFRLDDDDGMSVHFIAKLRRAARDARSLLKHYRCLALDFNKGFVIAPEHGNVRVAPVQAAYWGLSLGLLRRADAKLSIHSFGHHRLWQRIPTLTFPDRDMMLRGLHADNDSRQEGKGRIFDLAPPTDAEKLRIKSAFAVDLDEVSKRFSEI